MDPTPTNSSGPSLREALAATATLLDAMPWGVLALNEQRRIEHVNQQTARWCGAAPEALLYPPLDDAPLPPALEAALCQLLENSGAAPQEIWLPQAQQWVSLCLGPAPAGQQLGVLGSYHGPPLGRNRLGAQQPAAARHRGRGAHRLLRR